MTNLPKSFRAFMEKYPEIGASYNDLSDAVAVAGPLDAKSCALIKLGMCIGAGMEGGAHSQIRKALEAGASGDELRHAALQATTTLGFSNMMRALGWVERVLAEAEAL